MYVSMIAPSRHYYLPHIFTPTWCVGRRLQTCQESKSARTSKSGAPADGRWQMSISSISMQKGNGPMLSHEAVIYVGDDLLSHALSRTVQSALRGLTSVFGMGTGISHAVKSPALVTWPFSGPSAPSVVDAEPSTSILKELLPLVRSILHS